MRKVETPRQVAAAVNALWRGRRLIAPVGGVSIQADRALDEELWKVDEDLELAALQQANAPLDVASWWWD